LRLRFGLCGDHFWPEGDFGRSVSGLRNPVSPMQIDSAGAVRRGRWSLGMRRKAKPGSEFAKACPNPVVSPPRAPRLKAPVVKASVPISLVGLDKRGRLHFRAGHGDPLGHHGGLLR